MYLGLNNTALSRIASAIRHGQAAEQQLDWRDLQDLSMEITAAVEQQDMRRLMEAAEDLTSLILSHIQVPGDIFDGSGVV
jgi:hypothetical protein